MYQLIKVRMLQLILYLAASPTQTVETSGRICLIVSKMAIPAQIQVNQWLKDNTNPNLQ